VRAGAAARIVGLGLVAAALAGCVVGFDFKTPSAPSASAYTPTPLPAPADPGGGETRQQFAAGENSPSDWWTRFGSTDLDDLARAALANNQTLAAAHAHLAEARAVEAQVRGGLYPQVDFGATASRLKTSLLPEGINQLGPVTNDFTVGPSVSYALDVFGAQRRLREQKHALAEAQAYQFAGARLAVTGGVARTAIDAGRAQSQLDALEALIRDDEQTVAMVDRLTALHLKTVVDLDAARSQLAADRALLPPVRQQLAVDRDALAVLVGKTPADAAIAEFRLEAFTLPQDLPVSVPAELVRRRPDVRAAEAELHAASAEVGVATAQLYPSLNLSGAITQESLSTSNLFTGAATGGFLAASLAAPLFHGGELRAHRRETMDAYDAALASYRQTVLASCGQVADVLQALDHDAQSLQAEQQAVDAADSALSAARARYAVAQVNILEVLQAQRQLGQARIALIAARSQRFLDTVQLFAAMGGGWTP
jgi:NodT family efflux transporter outer membrane factor (OMF) lipoprotein